MAQRGYGVGASLASMGLDQKREATQMLEASANQESERERQNKMLEAQDKAGKQQLGGALGAAVGAGMAQGSAMGPWGALIGGVVGAVAGGLF
jgi:hypothetical protein